MEKGQSASENMRIYVGGLGAAMTEDDLRKVFHSVGGVVEAVDFVRTKSRSFAYVDFFPSSQSSLSKLFSTYNGCAWKGGKLRLEKAKENYLARLNREWEEDAQIRDNNVGADMELVAPESTEHVTKSEHINIFFPSLGEVKPLPISGTGTHKYDFPHVEVPPFPVHFCDCEEHNASSPIGNSKYTKTRDLNAENGGMDEDEIKMMNAVLSKLFERKEASQSNCNDSMALNDKHNSTTSTDNQLLEDNKVDSDEDNLVLNVMASNCNSKTMALNRGNKIFKAHGNSKDAVRDQKNNCRVQSKKRKSFISEEFDGNESVPSIFTSNRGTDPSYDPARSSRPQAPDRGPPVQSLRSQKSSWKTLIRDKSNVSFCISDILSSVPSANEEKAEADDLNIAHSTPNRNSNLASTAVLGSEIDEIQSGKINVPFSITDVLPLVLSADQEKAASADQEKAASADLNLAHSTPNINTDVGADPISKSKSEEMESVESFQDAQCTVPNVTLNKGRGSSWRKKSSWTQLVSEEFTSFSITQILPNSTSENQVQGESGDINANFSAWSETNAPRKQDSECIAKDEVFLYFSVSRLSESAMAVDTEPELLPQKKNEPSEDEKRKAKIVPGSLMKAVMRPGGGEATPSEGDQVVYHCTIRTLDGFVVQSTRSEFGGKGIPTRHVLGKSKMILGLLEGIPTMLKGEVAMFKMKPQMHYGEEDCPVSVSSSFPKGDELHFEIEMIDFFKAKVVCNDFGVVKKVISEGQGWESPREPYEIKAWISARTGDGKVILSHATGEPYFFTFGKSEVPKGLEMGIGTMTRGEKAVIFVTSQYLTPSPLITVEDGVEEVQFEVELVHFIQVRDMLGDGRLIKRRIHDGKGDFPMDCPLHDSLLRVHYKAMLVEDKKAFYDTKVDNDGQPLEFRSGEGLVPEGFEMSVRLMLPGEIALVTCPPDYAYDKFPRPANVPAGAHVQWEIELLGFEMPKEWDGLDFKSIMDEAEKIRNTGNRLFKEGKFELAKAKYEKVLREFNHVNPQDDEEGKVFSNTRNMLNLNVAACYLKLGECRKSIETCNKVIEANPANAKALYRRGMAYMTLGDFEEARNDFEMMKKADKSSETDATAALLKLKQKEQEVEKKARKQFKGLFDKKPGEISEVGDGDREERNSGEIQENSDKLEQNEDDKSSEFSDDSTTDDQPRDWLSRFWPAGRRIFSALGLNRCSIL